MLFTSYFHFDFFPHVLLYTDMKFTMCVGLKCILIFYCIASELRLLQDFHGFSSTVIRVAAFYCLPP